MNGHSFDSGSQGSMVAAREVKVSDAVAEFLLSKDIHFCFELVGGMITHLIDSLSTIGGFTIVSMHHEQAAGFAAEGASRATRGRRIAVAMATSGPGATNLLTAIGSCWFDSIPCLFITGQVNTSELKGERGIRQQGFQELDVVSLVKSITKYAVQVTEPEAVLTELEKAFDLATSGRPGPVLVDLPNNIQRGLVERSHLLVKSDGALNGVPEPVDNWDATSAILQEMCLTATRPLVCFGGGAVSSEQFDAWRQRLDGAGIAYVSTLMAQGWIERSPCYFNMIGAYGNREANYAIQNCDLLIVLGARLDVRQTGADVSDFARHAKIVQIDIDCAQLNNRVQADLAICEDSDRVYTELRAVSDLFPALDSAWLAELAAVRAEYDVDEYDDWPMSPTGIFGILNSSMQKESISYVCDVGNHQMWAAQSLRLSRGQEIHQSGGMGAMGFALPAAIGVCLAGKKKTIVLTGDGSLQVNIQELDTVLRLGLDMLILVFNNESLGMVKNFQDIYFDGRNQSTKRGYSFPNFAELAFVYGLAARRAECIEEFESALAEWRERGGPALIELGMPYATECRPRLEFGRKLDQQSPPKTGPSDSK